MDEDDREGPDDTLKLVKLKQICKEIKISWHNDCDRTEYMIELTKILKEILTKDSIEEYLGDENTLNYFMGQFMQEVLYNIIIQPKIFGEDGNKIGLELLLYIFKLFLKFHKNTKYSPLFEKIRYIFNQQSSNQFFTNHKYEDEINYNFSYFNYQFCKDFAKLEANKFNKGDEVDFLT